MDSEFAVVRRFFKVIMPGFETSLKLPPAFVWTLNNVDLNSKRAVLKSCKGSWRVGVKKCSDGLLHFYGESWKGYVSDHKLKIRDFIVFEQIGHLQFNTFVFDETCCEKDFAISKNEEEDSSEDDVVCLEHVEDTDGLEASSVIREAEGVHCKREQKVMRTNNGKSSNKSCSITLEEIHKYFDVPMIKAAKEMNVGLTVLKKRCRELNIARWPHRKIKSLTSLIDNAKEMGHRKEIAMLEEHKRMMLEIPEMELTERVKKLRQACFKANYNKRKALAGPLAFNL